MAETRELPVVTIAKLRSERTPRRYFEGLRFLPRFPLLLLLPLLPLVAIVLGHLPPVCANLVLAEHAPKNTHTRATNK